MLGFDYDLVVFSLLMIEVYGDISL